MRLPQDRILHIDTEIVDGKMNVTTEWQGELVRCKDCRFNKPPSNDLCPIKRAGVYPDDDDFCAYGERKELDKGGDNE